MMTTALTVDSSGPNPPSYEIQFWQMIIIMMMMITMTVMIIISMIMITIP